MENGIMQAEEIQVRLAGNLKAIRKKHKMTQFELAEKAGLSEAMVKSIELSHSWPSEKTLSQLSVALDTDVLNFFIPVSESLKISGQIRQDLISAIKKSFQSSVSEITESIINEEFI